MLCEFIHKNNLGVELNHKISNCQGLKFSNCQGLKTGGEKQSKDMFSFSDPQPDTANTDIVSDIWKYINIY